MGIHKATLQVWLKEWHSGVLPFDAPLGEDSYCARAAEEGVELQPQLRAAFKLTEAGTWDEDTYQIARTLLEEEHNVSPELLTGEATPTFSPWSPTVQSRPLPPGWEFDENGNLVCTDPNKSSESGMTGTVATAETVDAATTIIANPVRDGGVFLAHVAEVWYYGPDGIIKRQIFASDRLTQLRAERKLLKRELKEARKADNEDQAQKTKEALDEVLFHITTEGPTLGRQVQAKAWRRAVQLRESWEKLGVPRGESCVWVKYRMGESQGNRWVLIAEASGQLATPQEVTRLHSQAKAAGIKAKVGEKMCQTKGKHVALMLAQNEQLTKSRLVRTDPDGFKIWIEDLRLTVETPCVEPGGKDDIVYSIRFQSGEKRIITIHPLSDDKDEDGNVILEGHRKRAYRLLLDSPSGRSDSPATIKWVVYGKNEDVPQVFVTGRDVAIKWAEKFEEDEEIAAIEAWGQYGDENPDKRGQVMPERADEYISRKGRRLAKIDPPDPVRRGPTMHNPPTRVDYVGGRHYWGKARNTDSPGARWVGGMGYLEAQLYNLA